MVRLGQREKVNWSKNKSKGSKKGWEEGQVGNSSEQGREEKDEIQREA